ncbi:MAG: DNA polymerase I [Chloroflexota bacterium]
MGVIVGGRCYNAIGVVGADPEDGSGGCVMEGKPRLVLIDGHALAYRTYFALTRAGDGSRWITKSGEPTAGTYGFTSVLFRLLEQETPEYLAVSFDTGRTFRDDLYPDYKATRDKMPDDLRLQLDRIRQVVDAFEIPILEAEGYEADDVLGTVARRAAEKGVEVIILTGDRDLLQLVDERIRVRLAGQRLAEAVDYGPPEVAEKLGVRPVQIVDYKALVGDSSDNIPGVRGIGEKTALDLLRKYGTLEAIYQHLDELPPRTRGLLEVGRPQAELSQRLAAIVTDLPLEFDLEACRVHTYDRQRVAELFRELEFRSLLGRLPEATEAPRRQLNLFTSAQAEVAAGPTRAIVVNTPEALEALARRLSQAPQIALDVETTSTDAVRARLVGLSLAVSEGEGYYLPLGHEPMLAGGVQLELPVVFHALRPPLTNPAIPKIGHNLKYDYTVLKRSGLEPGPLAFDTMIAEWLIDPASRNLGLKNLAWVRLGIEMTEIESLIGSGRGQRSMAEVPIGQVAAYAAADAEVCLRLMPQLKQELEQKRQLNLFNSLEMPLVPVLAEMEIAGVCLDTEFLGRMSRDLAARLDQLEAEIFRQVGHRFNINSTQQLAKALFEDLGLTPPDRTRRTASGHYSTAASVLEDLRHAHPVVDMILEQREIAKLKSTYTDALPQQVNPETGRVHTSYSQTGTVTGRLASSEPNLQNIPIRTELGQQIRRAFIAAPGHVLLSVDYSQIELRIVAHMAEDRAMIQAFLEDQDIHAATAAAIYGVALDAVTPELRRHAKAINFGLIYGMSPYGLSRSTDLTLAEAERFVQAYFQRFPGVRTYLEHTRKQASELGFVETLLGRRRYFPELVRGALPIPETARSRAEREAINAPIQGTAADITKIAMLRLPVALREAGLRARMLLQVHDELVLECPVGELEPTASLVQQVMQRAFQLRVPLKTDATAGPNWSEMTPVS